MRSSPTAVYVEQRVIKEREEGRSRQGTIIVNRDGAEEVSNGVAGCCPHCGAEAWRIFYHEERPLVTPKRSTHRVWLETEGQVHVVE